MLRVPIQPTGAHRLKTNCSPLAVANPACILATAILRVLVSRWGLSQTPMILRILRSDSGVKPQVGVVAVGSL